MTIVAPETRSYPLDGSAIQLMKAPLSLVHAENSPLRHITHESSAVIGSR